MQNRQADISTEMFWEDTSGEVTDDEFITPIYRSDGVHIGYWLFKRANEGIFELSQLLPADFDTHQKVVSLSGVLYSRQEALRAHQAITAYVQGLNRFG